MKDKIFFPMVFLLALVLAYVALSPQLLPKRQSINPDQIGGIYYLSRNDIDQFKGDQNYKFRPTHRIPGTPMGAHLLVEKANMPNAGSGARLNFSDDFKQKTKGKMVSIIIAASPIKHSEARKYAIGIFDEKSVHWQSADVPTKVQAQRFDFAPTESGVKGILINPSIIDDEKGIELQAMAIKLSAQ